MTYTQLIRAEIEVPPEVLTDRLIDESIGLTATLLIRRNKREQAALLGRATDVIFDEDYQFNANGDPGIYVEYEPEDADDYQGHQKLIRQTFEEVTERKGLPLNWILFREVLPDAHTYGWRQQLSEALDGKRPSNHARKIPERPPIWSADHLAFTNDGELTVYRALKSLQESAPVHKTIGIFPLAAGRILGHTWEPDVIVTYAGRAGVLEIDGPHHNRRRAFDTTRDSLFEDAGIAYVQRITAEATSSPKELRDFLVRFLQRLAGQA